MKPLIKKTKSRNQYVLTPNKHWVRDFTQVCYPIDINSFTDLNDDKLLMDNELFLLAKLIPEIGSEHLPKFRKVVIVSDGYRFNEKKDVLYQLPREVCVIGTNRALAKWDVDEQGIIKRRMDFYFVNNPYPQCTAYLPSHDYRPRCICSLRTNRDFIDKYGGDLFYYVPTPTKHLGRKRPGCKPLDDYRNPICGALSLAIQCGAQKIAFFCCDDVFADERPATEQLPNGLWMYPQHRVSQELIEGILYWLRQRDEKVEVANCSEGPEYQDVPYISVGDLKEFLK